jgi:hypothetical protein
MGIAKGVGMKTTTTVLSQVFCGAALAGALLATQGCAVDTTLDENHAVEGARVAPAGQDEASLADALLTFVNTASHAEINAVIGSTAATNIVNFRPFANEAPGCRGCDRVIHFRGLKPTSTEEQLETT